MPCFLLSFSDRHNISPYFILFFWSSIISFFPHGILLSSKLHDILIWWYAYWMVIGLLLLEHRTRSFHSFVYNSLSPYAGAVFQSFGRLLFTWRDPCTFCYQLQWLRTRAVSGRGSKAMIWSEERISAVPDQPVSYWWGRAEQKAAPKRTKAMVQKPSGAENKKNCRQSAKSPNHPLPGAPIFCSRCSSCLQ